MVFLLYRITAEASGAIKDKMADCCCAAADAVVHYEMRMSDTCGDPCRLAALIYVDHRLSHAVSLIHRCCMVYSLLWWRSCKQISSIITCGNSRCFLGARSPPETVSPGLPSQAKPPAPVALPLAVRTSVPLSVGDYARCCCCGGGSQISTSTLPGLQTSSAAAATAAAALRCIPQPCGTVTNFKYDKMMLRNTL